MTRPFFSKERISHFDIFESHADDAIQQTKDRVDAGFAVDFQASLSPSPPCIFSWKMNHRIWCRDLL